MNKYVKLTLAWMIRVLGIVIGTVFFAGAALLFVFLAWCKFYEAVERNGFHAAVADGLNGAGASVACVICVLLVVGACGTAFDWASHHTKGSR
jgi:hypothetical protein